MKARELKDKISPSMIRGIANIVRDPTIEHKIEQIQGLIFLELTNKYWDNTNDEEEVL